MTDDKPALRYDLFVTHATGLILKLRDEGISPHAAEIVAMQGGAWTSRNYADIAGVNLTSGKAGNSGVTAFCNITFRGGGVLRVTSGNSWGISDLARAGIYQAFLVDFHQRLIASGAAANIAFRSGLSPMRAKLHLGILLLAALLFLALPLALFFATGNVKALFLCVGGVLFLWPAFTAARKNQPGTYAPESPPNLL